VAPIVFVVWAFSLVLLAIAAFIAPRPWYPVFAAGVFALDLWLGLQFLVDAADPIRL
jgi:hypothetical protein